MAVTVFRAGDGGPAYGAGSRGGDGGNLLIVLSGGQAANRGPLVEIRNTALPSQGQVRPSLNVSVLHGRLRLLRSTTRSFNALSDRNRGGVTDA